MSYPSTTCIIKQAQKQPWTPPMATRLKNWVIQDEFQWLILYGLGHSVRIVSREVG